MPFWHVSILAMQLFWERTKRSKCWTTIEVSAPSPESETLEVSLDVNPFGQCFECHKDNACEESFTTSLGLLVEQTWIWEMLMQCQLVLAIPSLDVGDTGTLGSGKALAHSEAISVPGTSCSPLGEEPVLGLQPRKGFDNYSIFNNSDFLTGLIQIHLVFNSAIWRGLRERPVAQW